MAEIIAISQTSAGRLVVGCTGLIVLTLLGLYVLMRVRDYRDGEKWSTDLLTKFRDLHGQGLLADNELRLIRHAMHRRGEESMGADQE